MTKPTETDTELRQWARHQFGLADDAPTDRAALLRQLSEEAFSPPPGMDYAARLLCGTAENAAFDLGLQEAQRELENQCREEVETFARNFFALPVRLRWSRYEELQARCTSFPALAVRLEMLRPGLNLDPAELEGPAGQLAGMLCELFVLAPGPRAARRRELLADLEGEKGFWESTAGYLKKRSPRIAELDPVFLSAFLDREDREERARSARKARAAKPAVPTGSDGGGGGSWSWGWLAIMVIIGIIRAASSSSSNSYRPPQEPFRFPQPQPQWQPNAKQWKDWQVDPKKNFDMQDLNRRVQEALKKNGWRVENGKLVPPANLKGMPGQQAFPPVILPPAGQRPDREPKRGPFDPDKN